ncbi:porin/voltage-dependent anion-selective channel protein [Corchorus capsularis]|uniref:Porin/voltage-dependent anion-selective channel protein n=1 Tax=Corchorus capsularis TaxID=210143 RepID=A0A1R3IA83_COCAP|nr:porin/voltage-dependent anion-selective channel protein [Corchorus capsularis]
MRIPSLWGQHALDETTIVKARMNNAGKASALIQQEWHRKSVFTISGEVDSKSIDKGAKVGLASTLKPGVFIAHFGRVW